MGAQVQTDPVTESITAEVIASQNAENAQSQRDAILAQQGNGDGNDGTDGTTGDGNTGTGFTDTQAENALDGGSGKGGSGSGANGQSNEDGGEKATAQMVLVIITMEVIMNLVQIRILHQAMIVLVQNKLITINRWI